MDNSKSYSSNADESTGSLEVSIGKSNIAMRSYNNSDTDSSKNDTIVDPAHGDDSGIKFEDWGFKVDRLFEVAYRFYKRNESKAFHPTFDERNQLNALVLQARYGNFGEARAPDVGALDLVGKSRRHEWFLLKGMSKTEAMSKFICTLDEMCPIFKAYAEAVKISYGLQSNHQQPEGESNGDTAEESQSDEQLKAIHTSLCRQTYDQFRSYAEKQYPNDTTQQKVLISSLQEQYYQQYISQMNPKSSNLDRTKEHEASRMHGSESSIKSSISAKSSTISTPVEPVSDYTTIDLGPPQNSEPFLYPVTPEIPSLRPDDFPPHNTGYFGQSLQQPGGQHQAYQPTAPERLNETVSQFDTSAPPFSQTQANYPDVEAPLPKVETIRPIDTWSCASSSDDAGSPSRQNFTCEPLEPATIWTKRGVNEFKESLIDDKLGGSYVVKQGTLLSIQVPTYPDGRFIHWEFATDDYDIGFGLDFVYEPNLDKPLAIKIQEESDDDEDSEFIDDLYHLEANGQGNDLEQSGARPLNEVERIQALDRRRAERLDREARTVSIVPTYRRDSHEEVFVGRHKYPGQGYYLLKFDNTYSVLRSKSLFFRICYFI